MVPTTKNKKAQSKSQKSGTIMLQLQKFVQKDYLLKIVFDPHYLWPVCLILLIFETILNIFIIQCVKYTEIDWIAYMQEVEGFLNGTLDYKDLKGDTGPLVYPAGFVYIYTILYYLTSKGTNILLAQYIFLGFYLIQTYLVQRIFRKTMKLPPYALIITTLTSYRIHSIFILRLFNDPVAVLLFYISLNLFIDNKWLLGSIFYSLAVSVKMNILLYAPCLLLAYLTNLSYVDTFINLFICGVIQLVLGFPFLYGNPVSYLKGSFDLGRVFEHKWTVNYRFLSREIFENKLFHIGLLVLHVSLLLLFLPHLKKYLSSYAKLNMVTGELRLQIIREKTEAERQSKEEEKKMTKSQRAFVRSFEKQLKDSGRVKEESETVKIEDKLSKIVQLFVLPFFVANLIGVACARSLHYQFYSWYFHSLPYLVFCTEYNVPLKFLLLALIEYCWNVYPSTDFSSALLHCCHIVLLFGVYKNMRK
ncbi:lethal(2)neighbour of tid protein [Diorhabda carinulata]|uniref:lethal(2)neighbour of tid protein n=1 Tax=Diorhabda carinulata TaxID=1163345 RepID=UPI0025A1540D|nr:lethal(2)neighbour of tid protein [Diorhabda carinulata]